MLQNNTNVSSNKKMTPSYNAYRVFRTWLDSVETRTVLTHLKKKNFFKLPAHSACVSLMSWWMKQRQARRWQSRGAGLRCEQVCGFTAVLEWEQFQVHSCGVWLADTPNLSACVEILSPWEGGGGGLGRRERWAGWGSSVNLISHCFDFEQWGRKRVCRAEC